MACIQCFLTCSWTLVSRHDGYHKSARHCDARINGGGRQNITIRIASMRRSRTTNALGPINIFGFAQLSCMVRVEGLIFTTDRGIPVCSWLRGMDDRSVGAINNTNNILAYRLYRFGNMVRLQSCCTAFLGFPIGWAQYQSASIFLCSVYVITTLCRPFLLAQLSCSI